MIAGGSWVIYSAPAGCVNLLNNLKTTDTHIIIYSYIYITCLVKKSCFFVYIICLRNTDRNYCSLYCVRVGSYDWGTYIHAGFGM